MVRATNKYKSVSEVKSKANALQNFIVDQVLNGMQLFRAV